jgi:hypothetical protein
MSYTSSLQKFSGDSKVPAASMFRAGVLLHVNDYFGACNSAQKTESGWHLLTYTWQYKHGMQRNFNMAQVSADTHTSVTSFTGPVIIKSKYHRPVAWSYPVTRTPTSSSNSCQSFGWNARQNMYTWRSGNSVCQICMINLQNNRKDLEIP